MKPFGLVLGVLELATLLGFGGCLTGAVGCKSMETASFDEKLILIDKVQELAEKNGVSWSADIYSNGDPSVFARTDFGLDTKVQLIVHVQGNAQNQNAEQPPTVASQPGNTEPETVVVP